MSVNIIDLVRGYLNPSVISNASTTLGESESGISKAINGLLPAVLGGLANNASHPDLYNYSNQAHSSGLLSNLGGLLTSNNSLVGSAVSAIFGDRSRGLIDSISGYSGVNSTTSGSLLNMVVGAVLGGLGKYSTENNVDQNGFQTLLEDQKSNISGLLPAGLSLGSLGFADFDDNTATPHLAETTEIRSEEPAVEVHRAGETHVVTEPERNDSMWKWLLPLLLLLLAGWFLMRQCNKKDIETTTTTVDSTQVTVDSTNVTTTETRELTDIDLNGTALRAYPGGMEDSMITFLKSDSYNTTDEETLKNTWYSFDNVNFKMGSATELEAGSEGQIQNLANILKAYPDTKIKIGGYTDATGDAAANKTLSQQRADFIKSELTKLGVGAQILGAEGYGSEFATVSATASDAERAVDRKMAVRFAK